MLINFFDYPLLYCAVLGYLKVPVTLVFGFQTLLFNVRSQLEHIVYCVLPCTASVMHSWVYSRGIFQTDVYGRSAMPQTIRCPLRCMWVSGRCMGKGRTNELNNLNITQNIGQ